MQIGNNFNAAAHKSVGFKAMKVQITASELINKFGQDKGRRVDALLEGLVPVFQTHPGEIRVKLNDDIKNPLEITATVADKLKGIKKVSVQNHINVAVPDHPEAQKNLDVLVGQISGFVNGVKSNLENTVKALHR